jgi:hypothetical protein
VAVFIAMGCTPTSIWGEDLPDIIWRFGDLEIWRFGDMAIWGFGDLLCFHVCVKFTLRNFKVDDILNSS